MTGQNHYKILGVPRKADLAQIRAAYVSLLKRHHPDKTNPNETQDNAAQVQLIIGAYRTLKDPRKRAAYDAHLRQMAIPRPHFTLVPPRAQTIRRTRRRFKLDVDTLSYGLMLVAAAVGLHLLASRLVAPGAAQPASAPVAAKSSVRELAARVELESLVRNAGMMSAAEARNFSARCFAAARRDRNLLAADRCVGFDLAYVHWRETMGGPLVFDPYYQPDAMGFRAREVFGRLTPAGAAARVQSIRGATLKAIMQTPGAADEFAVALSGPQSGLKPAGAATGEVSPQGD